MYVFPYLPRPRTIQSGVTVKHRLVRRSKRDLWRITTLKVTWSRPWQDNVLGKVMVELTSYKAQHFNHSRVLRSKKYIRFAVCF